MIATRPDAVLVPHAVADGPRKARLPNYDKVARVCDLVEPILGGERAPGRTAYVRNQREEKRYFCSLDPDATLLTPNSSTRPGRPRYRWTPVGDLQYGYLVDDA